MRIEVKRWMQDSLLFSLFWATFQSFHVVARAYAVAVCSRERSHLHVYLCSVVYSVDTVDLPGLEYLPYGRVAANIDQRGPR